MKGVGDVVDVELVVVTTAGVTINVNGCCCCAPLTENTKESAYTPGGVIGLVVIITPSSEGVICQFMDGSSPVTSMFSKFTDEHAGLLTDMESPKVAVPPATTDCETGATETINPHEPCVGGGGDVLVTVKGA